MTADNLLSPIVTSHCFFGCGRTVTDRPDAAHDEMEGHYTTVHQRDTEALIEAFRRIRPTEADHHQGPDMTPLTWRCLTPGCTATGTTNASAEKHTNEQRHVTTTEVRA